MLMTLSSNIPQSSVLSSVWGNYFCSCLPPFPVQLQVQCLTYWDCWKNKPLISWYVWQKMLVLTVSLNICLFPWTHQSTECLRSRIRYFFFSWSFCSSMGLPFPSVKWQWWLLKFMWLFGNLLFNSWVGGAHNMKNSLQVVSDYLHRGSFKCQEFFPHSCFWYNFSILAAGVGVIFSVGILLSLWNTQCI